MPNHRWGHIIQYGQTATSCNRLEYETFSSGTQARNQFRVKMKTPGDSANNIADKTTTPIMVDSWFPAAGNRADIITLTATTYVNGACVPFGLDLQNGGVIYSNMQNAMLNVCYPVGCRQLGWYPSAIGTWTQISTINGYAFYERTA